LGFYEYEDKHLQFMALMIAVLVVINHSVAARPDSI